MIKLIITDLDGTLLDDNKNIPPDFWDMHRKLVDKGILFAVASGRQYYNLLDRFWPIRDNTLFIAENGAFVNYRGEELHQSPLAKTSANKLIEIGRGINGAYVILCGKKSAYIESTNDAFLSISRGYFKHLEIVEDLTQVEDIMLKVTLWDFIDSETNSYPHYKSLAHDFKIAVAGKTWLDISSIKADKGAAILKIQDQFGISFNETLVFGDFLNDLEMMHVAKYNYAMKNAHPLILQASGFVTEFDNNQNGVIETIRKLKLIA